MKKFYTFLLALVFTLGLTLTMAQAGDGKYDGFWIIYTPNPTIIMVEEYNGTMVVAHLVDNSSMDYNAWIAFLGHCGGDSYQGEFIMGKVPSAYINLDFHTPYSGSFTQKFHGFPKIYLGPYPMEKVIF